MPRMVWPTWLSMLLLDSTRMKAGSLRSSWSWGFHLINKHDGQCETTRTPSECSQSEFQNKISPFRVREINIGPEFNDLSHCFLLRAGEKNKVNTVNTVKRWTLRTNRSQFDANLGVPDAGLKEAGAALLLASVRPAFVVADGSEDLGCSPSSSFSLSFSSCNTSTWA